ncbi:hypothetical protein EHO98_16630 [Leptospira stimsonii]|uniref:Uncharacterized protein n=1 Tax=Leptospira stimsonii TaxID=2202203 RepID=A0A4R9KYT3_9LEPT|nr:hypothetical protein [Leptospira stimsonii]RHX86390.1 hypothetical protein DLM78_11210 [Leptospira stimsonii]TGK14485.1 hypothetical protein EHO98_16630 [Leptospira stimsonii]TGM09908.1 hypothetical protein EHQ90_19585 [Leptospira stimsonii]
MVLIRETENEIEQQLRYFLEEKLEGILEEARKVKKRRQEVLHGKKWGESTVSSPKDPEEGQLTLWE